ncbi:hypothetical protein Hanom_Chr16g01432791 [Helianthus anomalus]
MKEIWEKLGLVMKKKWDFDKDLCSAQGGWGHFVVCNCLFENNTTCRVDSMYVFRSDLGNLLVEYELGEMKSHS